MDDTPQNYSEGTYIHQAEDIKLKIYLNYSLKNYSSADFSRNLTTDVVLLLNNLSITRQHIKYRQPNLKQNYLFIYYQPT